MAHARELQSLHVGSPHFFALDALRGIAALAVVLLHANESFGFSGIPDFPSGYLAVDLFFLLSGYVIASAYDSRLARGLSLSEFLKIRLVRLWPLYFIGWVLSVIKYLIQLHVGAAPPSILTLALESGLGLLMLPSPTTIGLPFDPLYFLNPVAWSLFFELVVNALYAAFNRRLSHQVLLGLLALFAGLIVGVDFYFGSLNVGNVWSTFMLGFPRALFPFFLGVYLYRYQSVKPKIPSSWTYIAMVVIFFVLNFDPKEYRTAYDLCTDLLIFPFLVYVASAIDSIGIAKRFSKMAGDISYAIYVIHMPVLALGAGVLKRIAPELLQSRTLGTTIIFGLLLGCWLLDRYWDNPVRKFLNKKLRREGGLKTRAPQGRT
jgi:peptidoglycan/LPS O-acetylase OafA/YrhL